MPFGIAQSLPKWPSVRILFHGLLLWYPDKDGTSCRIGVLRGAPDHYLSIEVRIKKQGDPDFPIMRHFAPMRFSHNDDDTSPGLLITVDTPSKDPHVEVFIPDPDFERSPTSTSDPQDYRWGVDLDDIHKVELQQNPKLLLRDSNSTEPSIQITEGILHTALKSHDDIEIKKVSLKTGKEVDFFPIAAIMGINMYLEPTQNLILRWIKEDGLSQELPLPRPDNPLDNPGQLSYEIYIDNNPTFTDHVTHSDFTEFYKAFKVGSLPTELFDLKFPIAPGVRHLMKFVDSGTDLGTPTIPCMPGGHG